MIRLQNLGYTYSGQGNSKNPNHSTAALAQVSLDIDSPGMVALLGANGSGKSTLLKILAGELKPSQGNVEFSPNFNGRIGYLPQQPQFDLTVPVTVFEVAAMGLWNKKGAFSAMNASSQMKVFNTLKHVGLHSRAYSLIEELSGGQLQRLRFARLLLEDATLLLLDEPFNAVDDETREDLMALLVAQYKAGCTIIAALHDKLLAQQYFTSQILLAKNPGHSSVIKSVTEEGDIASIFTPRIFAPMI